jgi:DNA-binding NtrC family response regulator
VPPLRERPDDILPLVNHFMNRYAKEMGLKPPHFSDRAMENLKNHSWPGNVRELENLSQRLLVNADSEALDVVDLPKTMRQGVRPRAEGFQTLAAVEAEHILRVLESTAGNKTQAAAILGIDRKTLREKLKRIVETAPTGAKLPRRGETPRLRIVFSIHFDLVLRPARPCRLALLIGLINQHYKIKSIVYMPMC